MTAACADGGRAPEPVPDGVLEPMFRSLLDAGGEPAMDQTCPECGGLVYYCEPGLVPADVAERVEFQCLECGRGVNEPRTCVECGETTREYSDPDADAEFPTCRACYWDGIWRAPEWYPKGGPDGMCEDCFRGEYDGVDVSRRQTWGVYPQDIRRVERRPMYCDDCWAWRQDLAPLKPTQDDIRQRRREVNQR